MLRVLAKTLPVFFLMAASVSFGQRVQQVTLQDGSTALKGSFDQEVVCMAGTGDMDKVPLPDHLKRRINARTRSAEFIVNYIGFPNDARDAFQYAVDIWSSIFESPVPIRVNATFKLLESPAIGAAEFTNAFANFRNAPKVDTWYQMPIAEKIAGIPLNEDDEPDIEIVFNNAHSWYYDIENPDGIDGTGLTDFATVVLHELGHAIGFSSFGANVEETSSGVFQGNILLGSYPIAYNTFLETIAGENLVDEVPNGGAIMASALTSNSLKFLGPTSSVRVYAPDPFNPGSSISHTDNLFGELMNPSLGPNGYIHDPGRALDMMNDFGWEFTYMEHTPVASTENFDQSFEIKAEVYADEGYDTASLQLVYSLDGFLSDTVKMDMTPTGETNMFSATIPNPGQESIISYFLTATDLDGRVFTNPGEAPVEQFFSFIAAVDDSLPEISHTPLDFLLPAEKELKINASITDFFTGVDTAYVEWFINDQAQEAVGMVQDPEFPAGWEGTLTFTSEFDPGDVITYQIVAIDRANSPNMAIGPKEGDFYSIPIEGVPEATTNYENDFNSPSTDFLGAFTIETPDGFLDGSLNSLHPYEEAGEGNEIQYITQLKVPIIIDGDNSEMVFDEIVLVEPGEVGVPFGQQEFWDYAIVEGSNDDGANWVALLPGYDCRAQASWQQRYESSSEGNNSTALGDPSLYRERTIDLLANGQFEAGETILIRFRLFSDPFAAGWGWAIDNLKIQGEKEPVAISDYLDPETDFDIYPNPSLNGRFSIDATFKQSAPTIQIRVMDTMGKVVHFEDVKTSGKQFSYQLDLSNQPPGMYLVNTSIGGDYLTRKVLKSN